MPSKAAVGVTTFRFDQMATLINDRVDNPAESGVERYVGLDHLDADSLRIRRWGEITDVESTKLRFQPGDIIFGKRRAYQRKLAVADFEGICSAHAMVLRAKGNVVLPEFLPFFMQSDRFMERAVAISVGSLSPTINWTTLAAEEFALPPIEEQRRLSDALRALQSVRERLLDVHELGETLRDSLLVQLIDGAHGGGTSGASRDGRWDSLPLGGRYEVALGKMLSPKTRTGDAQVPYMRNANVQWGRLDLSDVATMCIPASERERYTLRSGDILACEGRHVGKSVIWNNEIPGACYQKALHRLRPLSPELDVPQYLLLCLRLYSVTGRLVEATGETTIPHLPAERFREIVFPFPPRAVQESICERLSQLDKRLYEVKARAGNLDRLRESIVSGLGQ